VLPTCKTLVYVRLGHCLSAFSLIVVRKEVKKKNAEEKNSEKTVQQNANGRKQ